MTELGALGIGVVGVAVGGCVYAAVSMLRRRKQRFKENVVCVCVSDSVLLCVFVSTRLSGEPAGACSGLSLHMHTFIRKYVCT